MFKRLVEYRKNNTEAKPIEVLELARDELIEGDTGCFILVFRKDAKGDYDIKDYRAGLTWDTEIVLLNTKLHEAMNRLLRRDD